MDRRRTAVETAVNSAIAGCSVAEEWFGRTVVVSAAGDLDVLTSPQLSAGIDTALAKDPGALVVDLSGVTFLSSAGMAVLVAAREQAHAGDIKFGVVARGPATGRPLTLIGLAELVGMHPTLEEARAALGDV